MKTQIDNLVRNILHSRAQPEPVSPELADFFVAIGNDGHAKASTLRDILESYVDDPNLSPDMRNYAQQQLDSLLPF